HTCLAVKRTSVRVGSKTTMVVLRLRVKDCAKLPRACQVDASHCLLAISTGLGHHVSQSGALNAIEEHLKLFDGQAGWNRANDMLTRIQRLNDHSRMEWRWCKQRDGVKPRVSKEFAVVLIKIIRAVHLLQTLDPILAQVANSHHGTVRIKVPLKIRSESSSDDSDMNLFCCGLGSGRCV